MALMAMTGLMLGSCMGDSYADPDMVELSLLRHTVTTCLGRKT